MTDAIDTDLPEYGVMAVEVDGGFDWRLGFPFQTADGDEGLVTVCRSGQTFNSERRALSAARKFIETVRDGAMVKYDEEDDE